MMASELFELCFCLYAMKLVFVTELKYLSLNKRSQHRAKCRKTRINIKYNEINQNFFART